MLSSNRWIKSINITCMPGTDCLDKIAEVEYEMEMAIAGYGALRREAASQESA